MPGEMLLPKGGQANDCSDAVLESTRYEAPITGILPYRKAGTRGAPRGHDLGIGLRIGPDPFEEIEDQGVDGIRQRNLGWGSSACSGSGSRAVSSGALTQAV